MPLYLIAHITLMTLMTLLIGTGVILAHFKVQGWYTLHMRLTLTGVVLGSIGVAIVVIEKSIEGSPHLATPHEIVGAITMLLVYITALSGVFIKRLPSSMRRGHKIVGRVSVILLLVSTIMGYLLIF